MTHVLSPVAARVLGSLVEKEITTPEYYPLSLNALANACNQKNNREPVMNLDEDQIRQALHQLEDDGLAGPARGADSRKRRTPCTPLRFRTRQPRTRRHIPIRCSPCCSAACSKSNYRPLLARGRCWTFYRRYTCHLGQSTLHLHFQFDATYNPAPQYAGRASRRSRPMVASAS